MTYKTNQFTTVAGPLLVGLGILAAQVTVTPPLVPKPASVKITITSDGVSRELELSNITIASFAKLNDGCAVIAEESDAGRFNRCVGDWLIIRTAEQVNARPEFNEAIKAEIEMHQAKIKQMATDSAKPKVSK